MPITQLTIEQDLKMRQIEDALKHAQKEDIVTVYLALQRQCFVLGNNISQLVKTWPTHQTITPEDQLRFGTSSETNN
jgi:hypothetical protein